MSRAKILGVDDSLTIRKALEIVLKPAGYELELAVDGADALAKAKSFKPDIILLDFILPDMRGSEVCQHLALDPATANIPVVLVSAKGAEIRQAYRDVRNVVSYIAKPFKPQVITSIVAEVLAKVASGELIKSAVSVHEAEGITSFGAPPAAAPPPPMAAQPPPSVTTAAPTPPLPPPSIPLAAGPSVPVAPTMVEVPIATAAAEQAPPTPAVEEMPLAAAPPEPTAAEPAAPQVAAAPGPAVPFVTEPAVAPVVLAPPVVFAPTPSFVPPPVQTPIFAAAIADEGDEAEGEEAAEQPSTVSPITDLARREALELMFETLRAGIEGVYVEEVDTPLGAASDQAKSYTEILETLAREIGEGLSHARSGARHFMYGDGSVRSLDESMLEFFRRSCRLLFRAVNAGAVSQEAPLTRRRILVACQKDSQVHRHVPALLAAHPEWQVFTISEGFRQLPLMARLYGPTEIITEVTWGGALWDQLATLQKLPEARSINVIGVASPDRHPPANLGSDTARTAALAERGIRSVTGSVFDLDREFAGPAEAPGNDTPVSTGEPGGRTDSLVELTNP